MNKAIIILFALALTGLPSIGFSQTTTGASIQDFTVIKDNIQQASINLIAEIDLNIKPKAKTKACDKSVLKAREKALDAYDDSSLAISLLPDNHYTGDLTGLYCTTERASSYVSRARSKFANLASKVAKLARLEKTCKAKYGLSYAPNFREVGTLVSSLSRIPKTVVSCVE